MIPYGIQKITLIATESYRKDTSRDQCGSSHFSDLGQWLTCPVHSPPKWPPLLQVPLPEYRAVRSSASHLFKDSPDQSWRHKGENCPVTTLITGKNQTLAQTLAGNMFHTDVFLGSSSEPNRGYLVDSAFFGKDSHLCNIQNLVSVDRTLTIPVPVPIFLGHP
ncbi:hypothetical protein NC651_030700 [Populus alba x Populus x berolinensis]|nr:hypothetical protein NC651_030700 [Populus alba x Populus x berolinensis]